MGGVNNFFLNIESSLSSAKGLRRKWSKVVKLYLCPGRQNHLCKYMEVQKANHMHKK